jgi:hypothetical protein
MHSIQTLRRRDLSRRVNSCETEQTRRLQTLRHPPGDGAWDGPKINHPRLRASTRALPLRHGRSLRSSRFGDDGRYASLNWLARPCDDRVERASFPAAQTHDARSGEACPARPALPFSRLVAHTSQNPASPSQASPVFSPTALALAAKHLIANDLSSNSTLHSFLNLYTRLPVLPLTDNSSIANFVVLVVDTANCSQFSSSTH